jgi:hypothetical protein
MKKVKLWIITLTLLALVLTVGGVVFGLQAISKIDKDSQRVIKTGVPNERQTKQDPSLLQRLKSTGAEYTSGISLSYVSSLSTQSGVKDAEAVYIDGVSPRIEVLQSVKDDYYINNIIAHEYLHYIWYQRLSREDKDRLSSKLIALYSSDAEMRLRVENYLSSDKLIPTELFSIYCTESSDVYVVSILNDCNRYINRSSLSFIR